MGRLQGKRAPITGGASGIRVNVVSPGPIARPLYKKLGGELPIDGGLSL